MSERVLPIFVYGTLKSGESRSGMLRGLGRQEARVRGRIYHLPAGYPAIRLGGPDDVIGELVDPPDPRLLTLLDGYEGVSEGLYQRVVVQCILGLTTVPAWAWVMDDPVARGGRHLPGGVWTSQRRRW